MKDFYEYLNREIEYFFEEQEFLDKEFLLVDVSDYTYLDIDEDEVDEKKLMFGSEIVSIELEEEQLKIVFNKFYLNDLRNELLIDWNEQEIIKRRNLIYR